VKLIDFCSKYCKTEFGECNHLVFWGGQISLDIYTDSTKRIYNVNGVRSKKGGCPYLQKMNLIVKLEKV